MNRRSLMILSLGWTIACGDDSGGAAGATEGEVTGTSTVDPTMPSTSGTPTSTSTPPTTTSPDSSSSDGGGSEESSSSSGGPVPTERPSPRSEIEAMWDEARGRLVFFGGDEGVPTMCMAAPSFVGDTWTFNRQGEYFVEIEGAGPSPRGRYAMAADPAGERMIIHGGRFRDAPSGSYTLYDDTWVFDLTTDTWSEIKAVGPSARTNHTAVVAGSSMYLFGGNTSTNGAAFSPQGDLWRLDLDTQTWEEIPVVGGPDARLFHAAAVSDDGSTMWIYAGGDENAFFGPFFDDLWAYDIEGNSWTMIDNGGGGAPAASIWGDLMYDGAGDRLLLWSGHDDGALGNHNQIWSYALGTNEWTRHEQGDVLNAGAAGFCDFPADFVDPDLEAPERRNAGAAALTGDGELLVFGGKTDCGIIDDVWGWSSQDGTWTNPTRASSGEICLRAFVMGCTTMCF